MNVLIVGGRKKADFLAASLLSKEHHVTIVHDDKNYADFLARKHDDATIICGDGTKPYILEDALIQEADIVIAMTPADADNLVICQFAQKVYQVNRVFTTVNNPKNVDVFKRLGVYSVISATYIVAGMIEQMAAVNEIENLASFEQGKVIVMEINVRGKEPVVGKTLAEIEMPEQSIIGYIVRGTSSIVPNGDTDIRENDKLIILSTEEVQRHVVQAVVGRVDI